MALSKERCGEDVATASGPPTPCRRCAARSAWPCASGWRPAPGSTDAPGSVKPSASAMRHHGGRRAHGHAGAGRARDAVLDLLPVLFADVAGAALRPSTSRRRCREPSVSPRQLPRSIGAGGQVDAGQVHAEIAPISSAGVVLSQPPISTAAVDRMGAQQLLGLHRQEVAVEHGGRLDERLAERTSPAAPPGSRRPARRRA